MADITQLTHHQYKSSLWKKFRLTFEGGEKFREEYLKQFSVREDANDFIARKEMSYVPAFAKAAIIEIKNAIFNRMIDVKRIEGPSSFQSVVDGTTPGVDREDGSMNAFMGGTVLPELLAIDKVGIYVDRPLLETEATGTKMDDVGRIPYLYIYKAEDIRSWTYDSNKNLVTLLLRATIDKLDEDTGLVEDKETEYRLFKKMDGGVEVTTYDDAGDQKDKKLFPWTEIPCAIIDIPHSLLEDVADYQIAHLNIASADVNGAWKGNFAFYVEQRDPHSGSSLRTTDAVEGNDDDGTAAKARTAKDKEIKVGAVRGRSYAKGLDAPTFIHPSPEPLKVSMEKQNVMKQEIRQLVQLSITNMDPRRESAESKSMDSRGLEAGLSYIAQELERTERQVVRIWAMYEQTENNAQIKYPQDYSLKTTADRLNEGEKLTDLAKSSPSFTYQKEMAKLAAEVTLGNKVSNDVLDTVKKEIDDAAVVYVDPESLILDVEAGLATTETVSEIRGYPKGEAAKAKVERAERAAAIVKAQTAASAARGVPELDPDPENSPDREKELSQSRDISVDNAEGVRG